MTTGTSAAKQANRILRYINEAILPEERGVQEDVLKTLYTMHKLNPSCVIVTCPVQHKNFFYISDNCQSIFGHTQQHITDRFKVLEYYLSQIHEGDLRDFQNCMNFLESFMQTESPQDYHKLRTIFHYRYRNPEGKYIYLQDEKATIISENGTIVHYSLIRIMPEEAIFSGVKLEIYKDGDEYKKLVEHKPSAAKSKLSRRENDLVGLIKKGLTTKEIAWQLSISHNTVRNIKSKLFEKYSVNNTIELLNMTA